MKNKQKGFALIELVVVLFVVGIIILVISNIPNAISVINNGSYQSIGQQIASERIEYLRSQGFAQLPGFGFSAFSDPRLLKLPQGQATQYIEACPDTICPDSLFNPSNPDPIKQIRIKVTWTENGSPKSIEIITLISDGGLK